MFCQSGWFAKTFISLSNILMGSRGNESYNTNSPVINVRNYLHICACATYTSCGYDSRAAFVLFRIEWLLFKAGDYLKITMKNEWSVNITCTKIVKRR